MRRIIFAVIAGLLLCAQTFPPGALDNIAARAPSAPPIVSFVSAITMTGSGTSTNTITTANIGNPAYISNRRVIVVASGGSNGVSITSCTINAVTCDHVNGFTAGATSDNVWFVSAPVPTGTTGVTITFGWNFTSFVNPRLCIYNVNNTLLLSATPTTTQNITVAGTTNTNTVATTASGFILAGGWVGGATAGPTITASTDGLATDDFINGQAYVCGSANNTATNAASSVTISWTTASINAALALAAFR